ncbi:hypothetical protein [Ignatzschineria larvae]|uniref:hypothetical protein n=1 Tax=Ignatzschineria larvae TaxID=112009 RepID=UPI00040F608B|nr:hypothetical protein [Ignatzschineria larvae]
MLIKIWHKKIYRIAGGNDPALLTISCRQVQHCSLPRDCKSLNCGRMIALVSRSFYPALNQLLFIHKKTYRIAGGNDPVLITILCRQVQHCSLPRDFKSLNCGRLLSITSRFFYPALNQLLFIHKKTYRIAGGNDPVLITILCRQVQHCSLPRDCKSLNCGRMIALVSRSFYPALNQLLLIIRRPTASPGGMISLFSRSCAGYFGGF